MAHISRQEDAQESRYILYTLLIIYTRRLDLQSDSLSTEIFHQVAPVEILIKSIPFQQFDDVEHERVEEQDDVQLLLFLRRLRIFRILPPLFFSPADDDDVDISVMEVG